MSEMCGGEGMRENLDIVKQMQDAIETRFSCYKVVRCPSLKKMAAFIRERFGYDVEVESSWTSTDRPMGRLRHPGKGRSGNKLIVYSAGHKYGDDPIFEHDSSGTYRHNTEVARWILRQLDTPQNNQDNDIA